MNLASGVAVHHVSGVRRAWGAPWGLLVVVVTAACAAVAAPADDREEDPPLIVAECADPQPGWIFCDDFEVPRFSSYFEYDSAGGRFTRQETAGFDGSWGMRARFDAGTVSAGALHLAVGRTPQAYFAPADAGSADYRELYWRFYLRFAPGWVGGGGNKISRAFVFASQTTWAQAMIAHLFAGNEPNHFRVALDPVSGTDAAGELQTVGYNDFSNFRYLGVVRGTRDVFGPDFVGEWLCVESRVRLNAEGSSDGLHQVWIDGTLEAEVVGLNFVGGFDAYGLNAVYLENYWNAGAPATQERYFDRFVVSTQRIGC